MTGDVADLRAADPRVRDEAARRIWERFAPQLCAQRQVFINLRSAKANIYAARRRHFAGESAHALCQIAEMIFLRIDRPNDVAHCVDQLT